MNQLSSSRTKAIARGQQAALALADFIGRKSVSCTRRDTDRYGRMVAVCSTGSGDLASWLARNGLALAYRGYSVDYVDEEQAARAANLGVWRGRFVVPWDWRKSVR